MYNVQTKTQRTIAKYTRLGLIFLGIASIFATFFFMTQAILTTVYGLEATGSAYIGAGAGASIMTDKSQGQIIDSYVQNIKEQVCPTLQVEADYLECLQF